MVMISVERHDHGSGQLQDFLNQSQGLELGQTGEAPQQPIEIKVRPETIEHISAKLHQARLESGE